MLSLQWPGILWWMNDSATMLLKSGVKDYQLYSLIPFFSPGPLTSLLQSPSMQLYFHFDIFFTRPMIEESSYMYIVTLISSFSPFTHVSHVPPLWTVSTIILSPLDLLLLLLITSSSFLSYSPHPHLFHKHPVVIKLVQLCTVTSIYSPSPPPLHTHSPLQSSPYCPWTCWTATVHKLACKCD